MAEKRREETVGRRTPWQVLSRLTGSNGALTTFVLLSFVVLSAVWSLDRANWVPGLQSLGLVSIVAMFTGALAARIRWPAIILHVLALVVCSGMTLLLTSLLLPGAGLMVVLAGLSAWGQAVATRGISDGVMVFAVALVGLTWLVSYLSAWLIFRGHRVWRALIPSSLMIFINLSNLPSPFYLHLVPFLMAALLLVAHCTMVRREGRWRKSQTSHPRFARLSFLGYALWFVILAVVGAWALPVLNQPPPVGNVLTSVGDQLGTVQARFYRVFESIPSKIAPPEPLYVAPDQPSLNFGGPVKLTDQIIFTVRSGVPRYWRIRNYDLYTPQGWQSSETVPVLLDESGDTLKEENLLRRTVVTNTIRLQVFSPFFFSAGEPLSVDLPAVAEVRNDGTSVSTQPSLPSSSGSSSARGAAVGTPVSVPAESYASSERLGPDDVVLIGPESKWVLRPSQEYTVVSSLSEASPAELRTAGQGYPAWVLANYLKLPPELSARTSNLSRQITRGKRNPYDKVQAIQDYLRPIQYSQDVEAPPPGADGVDYFLFEQQAGYCQHFASAMVVMLRSAGIPSRLVAGYLGGDPGQEKGEYVIRERQYHAWAEVYFPGYGWVEFDPTPPGAVSGGATDVPPGFDPTGPVDGLEAAVAPDSIVAGEWTVPWADLPLADISRIGLIVAIGMAATGGMTVILFWLRRRLRRPRLSGATRVYSRMCGLASLLGLSPQPQSTPSEYAARLALALPSHAKLIEHVAQSYALERYGPRKALSAKESEDLAKAWRGLSRAFWGHFLKSAVARLFRRG